jgi:hypothetical protein
LEENTKVDVAFVNDAQNARSMTLQLNASGSRMAWGAPLMSFAVTVGFFLLMLCVLWVNMETLSDYQKTTIGIIIGYIGGAFNQAVNFWLGSTRQSKDKDNVLAALATQSSSAAAQSVPVQALPAPTGKMFR